MTNPAQIPDSADALAWALRYSERGWRVLPIKPNEKRPPMSAWQDAATTEVSTIENWWTQLYRGHGIGVATGSASGIFVLDVDVSDQKAGDETLASLEDRFGGLPPTPTVNTPSGGVHYYFAYPPGVEIRNDAGRRLGEGLDIRGDGGQVVAPPTTRAQGGYEWVEDTYLCEVAEAPRWLIEKVIEQQKPEPVIAPKHHDEGNGNSPADLYSERTNWPDLLTGDGWTITKQLADGETHWTRPGKDGREGASATTGHKGNDCLTVFTTSIDWLPPGTYSRFGYKACRDFDGDRSACGSALFAEDWAGVNAVLDSLPVVAPKATQGALGGFETGWEPVDLAEVLAEGYEPPKPEILTRSDGACLFYKGRINALYGESGSGKSWVAMEAAAQVLNDGGSVLYVDLEDHPGSVAARMMALGVSRETLVERFVYVSPLLAWSDGAAHQIVTLMTKRKIVLAVVDSTGEAMALDGAEPNSDDDTARWFRQVPRTMAKTGAAVVLLDHVPKAADAPRGFAIGSQRKRAAVDGLSLRVEVTVAPAKGIDGGLRLIVAKDRGGMFQHGKKVADVTIRDSADGRTHVNVNEPSSGPPEKVMKNISAILVKTGQISYTKLREQVTGRKETVRWALDELVKMGFVEEIPKGNLGSVYGLIRPFNGILEEVVKVPKMANPSTRPHPSPAIGDGLSDTPRNPSPPLRGDGTGRALDEVLEDTYLDPTRPHLEYDIDNLF